MTIKEPGVYYVSPRRDQGVHPKDTIDKSIKPWISGKHIIIAGAGMSGLSLAIAITQLFEDSPHSPPTLIIYERDSRDDRVGREGYTMSLRTDAISGGIQILDKLGLYETCRDASVTHAGIMRFWKRQFDHPILGVSVDPIPPKGLLAMRIRRNALQQVLANEAESKGCIIKWATAVTSEKRICSSSGASDQMQCQLSNGTTAICDLLIAADGASSKVLHFIHPDRTLTYAGITMVSGTGKFATPEDVPSPMNKNWGLVLTDAGTGVFVSPVDTTSALWGLSRRTSDPSHSIRHPMSKEQTAALLSEARDLAKHLDPKITTLIDATDPSTLMKFPTRHREPFPHSLERDGPVLFLGDANHAVSPFAGNGANMAIMDGWDLGVSLMRHENLEDAIKEYDGKFMGRAKTTLNMSLWNIDVAHAKGWKLWVYELMAWIMTSLFARK
jgi:2-polyprenyl-6-methoxyphenol hydroxylase-like FAD-dependent oxidoreductase